MRRLMLIAAAVLLALGPVAAGAAMARDHGGEERGHGGYERGHEGRGAPQGPPGWSRRDGERGQPPGWARGEGRSGGWARAPAPSPYGYGPPSGAYGPPRPYGVRRGGYLPPEVRGGVVGDYGRYRLRPPPRGYTWVRVGNAFLLVDEATGQIFDVIED